MTRQDKCKRQDKTKSTDQLLIMKDKTKQNNTSQGQDKTNF